MSELDRTAQSWRRVLVTGGGGFLGGALVEQLREPGVQVRSLSRRRYARLEELGVEQRQADLADSQALQDACRGCDVVFHVAGKAGIWGSFQEYYRTNVVGTTHVLQACLQAGVPKLVYTSSPSVVFDGQDMEGVDESVPYARHFKAAYPHTKMLAEQQVLTANGADLATVALRPHLIWGPRDTHIVPGILARGRRGQLKRVGKVAKRVDFTFVDNAAAAHLLAARRLSPGTEIAGRAFFISDGCPVPFWEFVDRVLQAAHLPGVKSTLDPRLAYALGWLLEKVHGAIPALGEPRLTRFLAEELSTAHWFDITAARSLLGYQPRVSMNEGFQRLEQWLRAPGS